MEGGPGPLGPQGPPEPFWGGIGMAPGATWAPGPLWGGIGMETGATWALGPLGRDWNGRIWVYGALANRKVTTNHIFQEHLVHKVEQRVEIDWARSLARSAPKSCAEFLRDCAKHLDGDPIGDKKV